MHTKTDFMKPGASSNSMTKLFFLTVLLCLHSTVGAQPSDGFGMNTLDPAAVPSWDPAEVGHNLYGLPQPGGGGQAENENASLSTLPVETGLTVDADYFSPGDEIDSLARGLQDDPIAIIRYVHDHIACQFYYGSRKGALVTLLEGSGNDFDHCSLLAALLKAAQTRQPTKILRVGYRYYPRNQVFVYTSGLFTNWLDLTPEYSEANAKKIAAFFISNGHPSFNGNASPPLTGQTSSQIPVDRVGGGYYPPLDVNFVHISRLVLAVKFVDTDGQTKTWQLDPHYKLHSFTPSLDLGNLSSYATKRSSILGRVTSSASNYTENVTVVGFGEDLSWLGSSLVGRLNSPTATPFLANSHAKDVYGGATITSSMTLPPLPPMGHQFDYILDSIPRDNTGDLADTAWQELPKSRASHIRLFSPNNSINWSLPTSELRGRCISLIFESGVAKLRLGDEVVATENPVGTGDLELTSSMEHGGPYVDRDASGAVVVKGNGDRSYQRRYKRTGIYAFSNTWSSSPRFIKFQQQQLSSIRKAKANDNDPVVIAHSNCLIGARYSLMREQCEQMVYRQAGVLWNTSHQLGVVGIDDLSGDTSGVHLDWGLGMGAGVPKSGAYTSLTQLTKPFVVACLFASACEHAVLEQIAGDLEIPVIAASTVRLIEKVGREGGLAERIYLLNPGNYGYAQPGAGYMVDYPASVQSILYSAAQSAYILAPRNGNITVGTSPYTWSGYGYAHLAKEPTSFTLHSMIGGQLNGGHSSKPGIISAIKNLFSLGNFGRALQSFGQALVSGADPVDMATGGFMLDETDLDLGGEEPRGLHLSRYYSTQDTEFNATGLGHGWTHSYDLRLERRSAPYESLGGGTPQQCAAAMMAVHTALDTWDETQVKGWVLASLAAGWGIDQMLHNAAEIRLGPRTLTFIRLFDGTYLPPTGVAATLTETKSGSTLTGYTLTMRHGNTITFDAKGRATTIRDPYNKELTLAYDTTTEKKLSTVTDAYNRTLTFNYSGTRLTGVSDSTGRSVTYNHDATGKKLESVTDVESKTTYYDTDANYRVWRHRDHDNRVITENVFDSQDRVVEQKTMGDTARLWKLYYTGYSTIEQDPAGGRREFQWDEKRRLVAQVDQMNRKTFFTYDGQDHRLRTLLPLGQVSESVYDAFHNVTSVTVAPTVADLAIAANRRRTQLFYDPATQHLDYAIDPRNKTSQVRYSTYHQLDQAISAEGVKVESEFYAVGHAHAGLLWKKHVYRDASNKDTTTFAYDANGHVQRIDYPDGTNVQFTHHARGDMLTRRDQRGHTTTFQYNNRRQPRFTFLPQVNGTTYQSEQQYDNAGNPWKSIDAYSNTTTTLFNALRKPVTTTFQETTTLTRDYDERDWLETVTDHLSHASTRTFHADGQVHEVFDPLTRKRVVSTYDSNGRPEYASTPKPNNGTGRATSRTEYTGFGEVFKAHDALSNFTRFDYDAGGNLQTRTNKRNHAWNFTYNDDNQLEDTTSPGNKTVQKRYNARGLLETVTEPSNQTTTFHYDSMGRLDDSVDAVGAIDYAYDDAGQTDTITQGGTVIDRDYDALGRLTKYQHGTDYTLRWEYHDPQNAVSLVYPDGVKKVRYDFDNRGRLSKVTDWAGRITRYQYDDAGRLRWTYRDYNGTKREVKYDAASQITAIEERDKNGGAIALFRYLEHWDNGQIKKTFTLPLPQSQALTLPVMTYNADNQLLTWKASAAAAARSVVHDDDGNTTTGPLPDLSSPASAARWASFGFDARNRLTSITATGVNSTHSYDAENLRTSVTENGVTSQWVINPHGLSGMSEALVRVKGGVTTRYVYGLGLLYEEEDVATPVVRTYHFDRQGSTAALTATDGLTVTDRFEYAAYGERTYRTGNTDTPFQFNGFFGVQTDASGLLYMRARYYNVETRRFQSADPMGFAESSNFYWFANADPVSLVDPFGLGASDGGGFWSGVGKVLGLVAREAIGVPRGIFDYFFENGVPVAPRGGLAAATGVLMNGIFGHKESFIKDAQKLGFAGYFNPSHGLFADVTQTVLSVLLFGVGDSLGSGFSHFLHQLPASALSDVRVHSQATAHTVMQAVHGNLPSGMNVALNSPAVNQGVAWLADAMYSGNLNYNQPAGDIANVYTFPLNPFRILNIMNPVNGYLVHIGNTWTPP